MAGLVWIDIPTATGWIDVHDAASIASGTDIRIQNLGSFPLVSAEDSSEPSEATTQFGTQIPPHQEDPGRPWDSTPGAGEVLWVWATYKDTKISVQDIS